MKDFYIRLKRRRTIWLGRAAANRIGVKPGYAQATLGWHRVCKWWVWLDITMDGQPIGSTLRGGVHQR